MGDPTRLFIKPEKPDFFLSTDDLGSLLSSEYRLGLINWLSVMRESWDLTLMKVESAAEKLTDWRRDGLMMRVSALVLALGGGGTLGRWRVAGVVRDGEFMASMRLRIAAPSNGAPMKSSDGLLLRGRTWTWTWESDMRSLRDGGMAKEPAGPVDDDTAKSPWGRMGDGFDRWWVEGG